MSEKKNIIVLKFGGSVLRDENDLPRAVHEIYRWWREGNQVLVVASAFGNTTDHLLRRAEALCEKPDRTTLATLLATGEAASSALLSLTLNRAGIPSSVLDPVQAGLRTAGGTLDADLISVDVARLKSELQKRVVVLPGFVARGENGNTTLLGRGGSDLSALFLAHRLNARCLLLKDVAGLYTGDPAAAFVQASRYARVSYETALRVAGPAVQTKAIRFAAAHRLSFTVASIGATSGTEVGLFPDRLDSADPSSSPLRVVLLGAGTVGGGVYQALAALPEYFTVVGVGNRHVDRARQAGVPHQLVTSDLEELLDTPSDAVIELIGGTKLAQSLVSKGLENGRHVITANKALLATAGRTLSSLAKENGVTLRFSAAVGGVMPALEAIGKAHERGKPRSFRGVLNGTSGFVLDRLAEGKRLDDAVRAAQEAGYTEANYRFDLDGTDAAQKLILLARKAFGVQVEFDEIERVSIEDIDPLWVVAARECGRVVRLVASCAHHKDGVRARVEPVELLRGDPLADTLGIENRLVIESQTGPEIVVRGKGCGRWPTTEAVVADLFDLWRELQDEELGERREEYVA